MNVAISMKTICCIETLSDTVADLVVPQHSMAYPDSRNRDSPSIKKKVPDPEKNADSWKFHETGRIPGNLLETGRFLEISLNWPILADSSFFSKLAETGQFLESGPIPGSPPSNQRLINRDPPPCALRS